MVDHGYFFPTILALSNFEYDCQKFLLKIMLVTFHIFLQVSSYIFSTLSCLSHFHFTRIWYLNFHLLLHEVKLMYSVCIHEITYNFASV